jgi:hypothetical protein
MLRLRYELYLHYAEVSGQTTRPDRFNPGNKASVASEQEAGGGGLRHSLMSFTSRRVIGRPALNQCQYL